MALLPLLQLLGGGETCKEERCLKVVVLQSAATGCEYEDDDLPVSISEHLIRAGLNCGQEAGGRAGQIISHQQIYVEDIFLTPDNYTRELVSLGQRYGNHEFDCIINLCDGAWDEPSVGIQVVDLLDDKLNLPFTGADVTFFEPTRLEMKLVALACSGGNVPAWRFVYSKQQLDDFLKEFQHNHEGGPAAGPLNFPLLPKHFSSYSSVGLTPESKVQNVAELAVQCQRMLDRYGGCLVEEFVEGREFTVLVAQVPCPNNPNNVTVMAYQPIECQFLQGDDFKHYNLKWIDYDSIMWTPVVDADLAKRLKDVAMKIFQGMNGRGYGRLDFRSDPSGQQLYFLEINPNCGIFYPQGSYGSADFILDQCDSESAHATFILSQIEVARRLWRAKQQPRNMVEPRYDARKCSWGLFALRDIQQGEMVQQNEENAMNLVSKAHVLKHWIGAAAAAENEGTGSQATAVATTTTAATTDDDQQQQQLESMRTWTNFKSYCWPVSENLFVMWDPKPEKWCPLNHSCDPNAWNEDGNGLNVVARRFIAAGEEVTMDYATFVGYFPEMTSFQCVCGSPLCRQEITGMDIVTHPELAKRYAGHMTDYVTRKSMEATSTGAVLPMAAKAAATAAAAAGAVASAPAAAAAAS